MIAMVRSWRRTAIWALKVNVILLLTNFLVLWLSSLILRVEVFPLVQEDMFSMMLLLESGVVFLVGGLIAMSSSIFPSKVREHVFHSGEEWSQEKHEKSQRKANLYIFMGILLFMESMFSGFII